jgi:hypothetical protein
MEALRSLETTVLIQTTWLYILEDSNVHLSVSRLSFEQEASQIQFRGTTVAVKFLIKNLFVIEFFIIV